MFEKEAYKERDEEMAEEFASNGYALGCTKSSFEIAKKSFLAGFKAGRETERELTSLSADGKQLITKDSKAEK